MTTLLLTLFLCMAPPNNWPSPDDPNFNAFAEVCQKDPNCLSAYLAYLDESKPKPRPQDPNWVNIRALQLQAWCEKWLCKGTRTYIFGPTKDEFTMMPSTDWSPLLFVYQTSPERVVIAFYQFEDFDLNKDGIVNLEDWNKFCKEWKK